MPVEEQNKYLFISLKLPNRLFIFSLAIGLLTPLIARLPSVPIRGWEWVTCYFGAGLLYFSAFNSIPGAILYLIGRISKNAPIAFWFSTAGFIFYLLGAHGSINLSSSSTAVIGLLFIPIYAVGVILAGWALGFLVHGIIKNDLIRLWSVRIVIGAAVIAGAGIPVWESLSVVARESRFPFTAIANMPLEKRQIYTCDFMGRVKVLALNNFDNKPVDKIVALGDSSIAKLNPATYAVESKADFNQEDCDSCTHMYPYVIPDGKGSILVSTSDGVSDIKGHLIWAWKASGFSRVVPIRVSAPEPSFFVYQHLDHVALHDATGKKLWKNKQPVSDIGFYETLDGKQLPFARTDCEKSHELKIFDLDGSLYKTIKLPEWASEAEALAWPRRGHLLVGYGSHLGVLDPNGKEVLQYVIKDTSFNPYHGPNGTAVKFSSTEDPYLAVVSHGSSGYARSVLLVFDSKGNLVWQEELKKLSSIIAVPNQEGTREVLLVGGIDGIFEYKLANRLKH